MSTWARSGEWVITLPKETIALHGEATILLVNARKSVIIAWNCVRGVTVVDTRTGEDVTALLQPHLDSHDRVPDSCTQHAQHSLSKFNSLSLEARADAIACACRVMSLRSRCNGAYPAVPNRKLSRAESLAVVDGVPGGVVLAAKCERFIWNGRSKPCCGPCVARRMIVRKRLRQDVATPATLPGAAGAGAGAGSADASGSSAAASTGGGAGAGGDASDRIGGTARDTAEEAQHASVGNGAQVGGVSAHAAASGGAAALLAAASAATDSAAPRDPSHSPGGTDDDGADHGSPQGSTQGSSKRKRSQASDSSERVTKQRTGDDTV